MGKVYQIITDEIIKRLEEGNVPWHKPWNDTEAVNWVTQKPYRGINTLLLHGGEYATFNQIKKAGGKVKKGETSSIIVFWKMLEKEDEETEEVEKILILRYYRVFEVGTQVEGIEPKRVFEEHQHDAIEEAEKIIEGYVKPPKYTHISGRATYSPSSDRVNVPPLKDFKRKEEYYSTFFHEIVHSTGHQDRLNRKTLTSVAGFGSKTYSKEELVAEIGASMLCGKARIENATIDNSVAYINGWLKKLKSDNKFIVSASQQAQKACDWILGVRYDD